LLVNGGRQFFFFISWMRAQVGNCNAIITIFSLMVHATCAAITSLPLLTTTAHFNTNSNPTYRLPCPNLELHSTAHENGCGFETHSVPGLCLRTICVGKKYKKLHTVLSYLGVVYLLYMFYFKLPCVYCH